MDWWIGKASTPMDIQNAVKIENDKWTLHKVQYLSGSQSFSFPEHLKIVDGLACVMCCAIHTKGENN